MNKMRPSSNFCILSLCVAETEAGTKYSSIRTQFVKSKNKLEQATRSRAGATTVKLWKYHNLCLFPRDHVDVAPQVDSIPLAASVNGPHQHSDTRPDTHRTGEYFSISYQCNFFAAVI